MTICPFPVKVAAAMLQVYHGLPGKSPGAPMGIEVSSSNFPRFDRNLNTGGRNFDESKPVVAHNVVHHSALHPSQVTITVVKR